MNQLQAFHDTIALAEREVMPEDPGSTVGFGHLRMMLDEVTTGNFSEAKLGRWLGWAQCAVVAGGYASLEEMKEINRRNA